MDLSAEQQEAWREILKDTNVAATRPYQILSLYNSCNAPDLHGIKVIDNMLCLHK